MKKYQKIKIKSRSFPKKTTTAQKRKKIGAKEKRYLEEHLEKTKVSCVSMCYLVPCACCSYYPSYLFLHNCLSHTLYLEHFRPATRTSIWDYNSALLSVTDLCATYTYFFSLCAFQAPHILQISTEKSLQLRCHFFTGVTTKPPVAILCSCW